MAVQGFTTSHALVPQQWSEGLEAEVLKKISWAGLVGKRSDSLVQWKDNLSNKPGDTDTIGLRMQLDGTPKTSSDAVEGNEQTLTIHDMTFTIDEVVDAVRFKNVIDRQRVNFDMRDEAKAALADQLAGAWDTALFNQLAGRIDQTGVLGGHNSVLDSQAASPGVHRIARGASTVMDQSLGTDDTFDMDLIDLALETAKTTSPAIRPAKIPGFDRPMYVCFIHPYQKSDLMAYSSGAPSTIWGKIQQDYRQGGGEQSSNPLITGACGVYGDVLFVENSRVPYGLSAADSTTVVTNVRRAIFCGAQSAVMGWGRLGGTPRRFRWTEKQFDYDREYGVAAGFLGGIKQTQFNSLPFSTICISTYSIASVLS